MSGSSRAVAAVTDEAGEAGEAGASDGDVQVSAINRLPERILRRVFGYLPLEQLSTVALVCRKWNATVDNDTRWEGLCRGLGMTMRPYETLPWRHTYLLSLRTAANMASRASMYGSLATKKGHKGHVTGLAVGGGVIVTGSGDTTAKVWSGRRLNVLATVPCGDAGLWALDRDPDTGLLAVGDNDGYVHVYRGVGLDSRGPDPDELADADPEYGGAHALSFKAHTAAVSAVQLEGTVVITGSFDNSIAVHDVLTGTRRRVLQGARAGGHKFHVWCLAAAAGLVVSGGWDCKVKVWDLESGTAVRDLVGHSGPVRDVAFDGERVVSGSWDKTVMLWDATGAIDGPLHTLRGHSKAVTAVAVDDTHIYSGSNDGTIRVWALSGAPPPCIRVIKANPGGVLTLAVDWRRIYAGGKDKKLRVIDFALVDPVVQKLK